VRRRLGLIEATEAFWNAVRGNLLRLDEARDWWHVVTEAIVPVIMPEDAPVTAAAAGFLEQAERVEDWPLVVEAVKKATGRKGRALFHPLRLALTGRADGPELKDLLPLIGRDRAIRRLKGETA
jgi:glutamyl-tRNA synthetase